MELTARRLTFVVLPFALPLLWLGCSAKVDGPTLALTGASPNVICDPTATITITGSGFSPLPVGTLSGTAGIAVPLVILHQTADLAGMPVTDAIDIKIDETQHVHWVSATSISFDLTTDLILSADGMTMGPLPAGVYNITVVSPATPDVQTQTLGSAFALIGAADIDMMTPDPIHAACDGTDQDQGFKLDGSFLQVSGASPVVNFTGADMVVHPIMMPNVTSCTPVPGLSMLMSCTKINFSVPKGTLTAGQSYTVSVENPAPLACAGKTATFKKPAKLMPPTITSISPTTLCANSTKLTVNGANYNLTTMMFTATLNGVSCGGMGSATQLMLDWGPQMGAMRPMLVAGTPAVLVLTNPDMCTATMNIPVGAGTPAWFVDAKYAIAGVTTPISIFAPGLMGATTGVLVKSGLAGDPGTDIGAMADAKHPGRLLATVPSTLAAGDYDLALTDTTGCPSLLAKAITVVDKPKLIASVAPGFGYSVTGTKITITTPMMAAATAPRAYLVPKGGGTAIALTSSVTTSPTTVQAVVPPGVDPAGNPYLVEVIAADGAAYALTAGYYSAIKPVPHVDFVTPAALPAFVKGDVSGPSVVIKGGDFRDDGKGGGLTVKLLCTDNMGKSMGIANVDKFNATSISATFLPIKAAAPGALCTLEVTSGDEPTFVDYTGVAIAGAGGVPTAGLAGPDLTAVRRGPGLATVGAGNTRVLCAVGGDGGTPMSATDSVECSDASGITPGAFALQGGKLAGKRTLSGAAGVGRYLYVVGGSDEGGNPLATVERAMLLDPAKAPQFTDWDAAPVAMMAMGVGAGSWTYRVSAVMADNDPDNPGGETLPSEPLTITLPAYVMGQATLKLTFSAVAGAASYRIYRSPSVNAAFGGELLADTVMMGTTFTEAGKTPMGARPVAAGSLGNFAKLPAMTVARESAAVTVGVDPANANKVYLYALGGRTGMPGLDSYEFLPITIANGVQTAGVWKAGAKAMLAKRFQGGAWSLGSDQNPGVNPPDDFVYVGGGTDDGMNTQAGVEWAKVAAGGDLGTFTDTMQTITLYGFAAVGANNMLLAMGGIPASPALTVASLTNMPPAIGAFGAATLMLQAARILPGGALGGPAVYLTGGNDMANMNALQSTEWFIY